jgi:glycosyltransferase involved in cell wall biosynthesis
MKILQVLDPAHEHWVQGGTFKDLRLNSEFFETRPVYLGAPFRTQRFRTWICSFLKTTKFDYILFSSITPLENYYRLSRFFPRKQKMAVWFTHQEGEFTPLQLSALDSCAVVFVHSLREKMNLELLISSNVEVTLGAIDSSRFSSPPKPGKCVVWIGTPNIRKNPDEFLRLASENPSLSFRILGKNWLGTHLANRILQLPNIEYSEIIGPLKSSDLDGCDIYICTSMIEGGPMPLLESIAGNLKVLSRDVGFVRDVFYTFGISTKFIYSRYEEILPLIGQLRNSPVPNYSSKIHFYSFNRLSKLISESLFSTGEMRK